MTEEQKKIIEISQKLIGKPYKRGGDGLKEKAFDCSGLIRYIYYKIGYKLPKSTIFQAGWPEGEIFYKPLKNFQYQVGDVLFMRSNRGFYFDELFQNKKIYVGHNALYLGNNKIIHATTKFKKIIIQDIKEIIKNKNNKIVLVKRFLKPGKIFLTKKIPQYENYFEKYWQKRIYGIISLALIIDYYQKKLPDIKELFKKALEIKGYIKNVGWRHQSLAELAKFYNLKGKNYDFSHLNEFDAFTVSFSFLKEGPFIASIYKNFNPKNDGHLIVINGFVKNKVYFTDPHNPKKTKIDFEKFINGFKKRIIFISK